MPQLDRVDLHIRAERLVARAHEALSEPRDRAALRRGLGYPPSHPQVRDSYRIVDRYLPERARPATERAFYTVAALIAAQPRNARDQDEEQTATDVAAPDGAQPAPEKVEEPARAARVNLGMTMALAVNDGKLKSTTTEARLHLLCRQDVNGIHRHLPRLIAHLRADLVPVSWVDLLIDLIRWERHRDEVARQWLRSYHRTVKDNPSEEGEAE